MKKAAIFYDTHVQKSSDKIKKAVETWTVDEIDIYPVVSLTEEKIRNYETFILVSPNWQSGKLPDEWHNAALLFKKSDLKSKKIALAGYDEQLNICPALGLREELKDSGVEFLNKCVDPGEKYAGIAVDEADKGKVTETEVKEETKDMNYNPNSYL